MGKKKKKAEQFTSAVAAIPIRNLTATDRM
jgi:hypothetical protein